MVARENGATSFLLLANIEDSLDVWSQIPYWKNVITFLNWWHSALGWLPHLRLRRPGQSCFTSKVFDPGLSFDQGQDDLVRSLASYFRVKVKMSVERRE